MLNKNRILPILLSFLYSFFAVIWFMGRNSLEAFGFSLSEIFTDTYGLVALISSILGFYISYKWGFVKSVLGKSLFFLSLGLFLQFCGQIIYSYYALVLGSELPYPSVGDLGYFGSIFAYIYRVYLLAHASGFRFSLSRAGGKFLVIGIPLLLLVSSYFVFLYDYDFYAEDLHSVKVLLDFGYPLGQATYLALALITLILTKNYLGGVARKSVLILLLALFAQYLADFVFLYKTSRGIWEPGGLSDLLYLISYGLMTMGLLSFKDVLDYISERGHNKNE